MPELITVQSMAGDIIVDKEKMPEKKNIHPAGFGNWSSIQHAETIKYGYIIPHDAEAGLYSQSIDMDELSRACGMIPAKHIFILGCCFSGVAALTSRAAPRTGTKLDYDAYLREATERSARKILTAGASDEFAADSGLCPGILRSLRH